VPNISRSAQTRSDTPEFPRGPRRVRRNPRESYRQLALDYEATEELIAELKMSEQEAWALADAARSSARELVALLSHELRNPLQAIFGYAELLQEGVHGDLNPDQLIDVNRIQESQHQLLQLLNSVLMRVRTERLAAPASSAN
jgi:Signal transduction histidine kinase